MPSRDPVAEFRADWLPHVTNAGLTRLSELLEKGSPLLIHGTFAKAPPMGCLATHIAWNHPATCRLQQEAGIVWLTKVAGLNPATSALIVAWDRDGLGDFELRCNLLGACRNEQARREAACFEEVEAIAC